MRSFWPWRREPLTLGEAEARIARWVVKCFGRASLESRRERTLRLLEEAIELAQAEELALDDVIRLVTRVFNRPPGTPENELSGVILTTLAYCKSTGFRLLGVAQSELERIERLPVEFFEKKHQSKVNDGTSVVPLGRKPC